MTASTDCSTALTDDAWSPDTVLPDGSKIKFTGTFVNYDRGRTDGGCYGGGSGKDCPVNSFQYVCYQVQARNSSGTVVATSPAILVKFGGTSEYPGHGYGRITAIDGTAVTSQGASDPLANLPAEVTRRPCLPTPSR